MQKNQHNNSAFSGFTANFFISEHFRHAKETNHTQQQLQNQTVASMNF